MFRSLVRLGTVALGLVVAAPTAAQQPAGYWLYIEGRWTTGFLRQLDCESAGIKAGKPYECQAVAAPSGRERGNSGATQSTQRLPRPGVESAGGSCPPTEPIKGNFTPTSGERCIYHMPLGEFYDRTFAERCYATEADARRDGCRPSKR